MSVESDHAAAMEWALHNRRPLQTKPQPRGITLVNREVKALGLPVKLVRGNGYYYYIETDDSTLMAGCTSASVPCYRLNATTKDVIFALDYLADHLGSARFDDRAPGYITLIRARIAVLENMQDETNAPQRP